MKKYLSRLTLAVAVALVMSLGVALPALADNPTVDPVDAADFSIAKRIVTPEGTTIPASEFHFEFTQLMPHADGGYVVRPADHTGAPAAANIPNAFVTFARGDADGRETVANILDNATFPHAGDFTFLVREIHTAPTTQFADPDFMNYSEQVFVIIVRVVNAQTDTDPFRVEPSVVVAAIPTLAPGGVYTWSTADGSSDKIDAIEFVNVYSRNIEIDPTDPYNPATSPLTISKMVTGDFANLLTDFTFETTLTIPQEALDRNQGAFTSPVTATVVDTFNNNAFVKDVPFTGTPPTLTASYTLRHGQVLVFPTLPAGTGFEITEIQATDYDGSAALFIGGVAVDSRQEPVNTNIETDRRYISDALIGGNRAEFTNNHNVSPLTGLMVTSMPLAVALVAAALVLAMMVASRSRRRIEQLPAAY